MDPSFNGPMLGPNNAFLVKRKSGGGFQFSRDPLNVMNKHTRKVGCYSHAQLSTTHDSSSMPASSTTRYATTSTLLLEHYTTETLRMEVDCSTWSRPLASIQQRKAA